MDRKLQHEEMFIHVYKRLVKVVKKIAEIKVKSMLINIFFFSCMMQLLTEKLNNIVEWKKSCSYYKGLTHTETHIKGVVFLGVVANVLNCNSVISENPSRAIMFTFELKICRNIYKDLYAPMKPSPLKI